MLNELFALFILHQLSTVLLPTDGAELESAVSGTTHEVTTLGENGAPFNSYLQYVQEKTPKKIDRESLGVMTTARSTIVVDADTGVLLFGERPYDVRAIASVTKLMTIMVFLDTEPNLDAVVTLDSRTDLVTGGRQYVGFHEGVVLRDVLGAALVGSDNSATQSLVRFSDMTQEEFVGAMNQKAKDLGLSRTFFTDPTGIQPTNVSTAHEITRLLSAAEKYPEMQPLMRATTFSFSHTTGRSVTVDNTNDALSVYQGDSAFRIVAGKTGYLAEAGYVLSSTVESRGRRLHVVVMGAQTRELRSAEMRGLAEWAFRVYRWPEEL